MSNPPKVVTRIFVNAEGDLVVTDLWDEVKEMLGPAFAQEDSSDFCDLENQRESH